MIAEPIPSHIAIMMDGNGRWATARGLTRTKGHYQGMLAVKDIIQASIELGIKHLTLYAFSTENWTRPKEEVDYIMRLPFIFFRREISNLVKNGIRVRFIGDLEALPDKTRSVIEKTVQATERNQGLSLNIAINYGGRADIVQATKRYIESFEPGSGTEQPVSFGNFKKFLWTGDLPDADLLIRTSGERRISNFLLLQTADTELWFTDTYWPDFNKIHLLEAATDYRKRKLNG